MLGCRSIMQSWSRLLSWRVSDTSRSYAVPGVPSLSGPPLPLSIILAIPLIQSDHVVLGVSAMPLLCDEIRVGEARLVRKKPFLNQRLH